MNQAHTSLGKDEQVEQAKHRWRRLLIPGADCIGKLDGTVADLLAQQVTQTNSPRDGGWGDVETSRDGALSFDGSSLSRPVQLARAWAARESRFFGSALVAERLAAAARFHARFIYPGCPFPNNWWAWQIGIPHQLSEWLLLAGDALPEAESAQMQSALQHLINSIWSFHPGANRMSTALSFLGYGLVAANTHALDKAHLWADEASAMIHDPRQREQGFREDHSYFFHGSGLNLGYGRGHFCDLCRFIFVTEGTPWEPGAESRLNAANLLVDFIQWPNLAGRMDPFIVGRGISASEAVLSNAPTLAAALLLTETDVPRKPDLVRACQRLIAGNGTPSSPVCRERAARLPTDAPPALVGVRYFREAEYAVARGERYVATVKMASFKTKAYFGINHSNLKGWHISDGHLVLRLRGDEFCDGVIPTMDWERLSGITRSDGFSIPAETMGHSWFVAGAHSEDGSVGCCGVDFVCRRLDGAELLAKKNWFFLEDAIVATGSGISCEGDGEVETVIRTVALPPEREAWASPEGERETQVLAGHDCVYILPESPRVRVRTEWREGSFADLRNPGPVAAAPAACRRRFWSAVIPHGPTPREAGYVIVYLPGATEVQAQTWWEQRPFEILQRDALAHSLYDRRSGNTLTVTQWDRATIERRGPEA